ncbi:MAG TPA: hypothetical protein VHZ04_02780 [Candidatus Paceibacterota bacterium]|jgi:predicted nuclease with TOPRIM domain|nr:hypothetical protein [Candidatus Paceibacterota bacterium]
MPKARSKNFEVAVFEQFKLIDERFGRMEERFAKFEYRLGQLDERMDRLEENQRKLGVGFEDLNDRFTLLLEGYNVLDAKVDRMYGEFRDFREEVNEKFAVGRA